MKITVRDIAKMVSGETSGDVNILVTGVSSLQDAGPQDLSFFSDPKYHKDLTASRAGVILLKKGFEVPKNGVEPSKRAYVFVDNPQLAFSMILEPLAREMRPQGSGIHPTTQINKSAKIGANVSIGPFSVVESDAEISDGTQIGAQCYVGRKSKIGRDCVLYPQVTLREETILGARVTVHSGTVIGSDGFGYATVGKVHHKIHQIGTVEIGDDVEIGANVTVDRAAIGKTVIGKGTKIDNLVQIAHNVQIGEGCIIVAQAGISGSSKLGQFVVLAGQVGVVGHISIGDGSIAAAQSGVPNDLAPGSIVFGSPARPIQQERKIQAILGKLPEIYKDFKKIKKLLHYESKDD